MSDLVLDRPIAGLTLGQLKEGLKDWIKDLIREVIREDRNCFMDAEGYLVFATEKDYAAYLKRQSAKYPSEVRAYFLDEHGFKVFYSDYEPTPKKAKELEEARKEIAQGKVHDFEEVCRSLGLRSRSDV